MEFGSAKKDQLTFETKLLTHTQTRSLAIKGNWVKRSKNKLWYMFAFSVNVLANFGFSLSSAECITDRTKLRWWRRLQLIVSDKTQNLIFKWCNVVCSFVFIYTAFEMQNACAKEKKNRNTFLRLTHPHKLSIWNRKKKRERERKAETVCVNKRTRKFKL